MIRPTGEIVTGTRTEGPELAALAAEGAVSVQVDDTGVKVAIEAGR